MDNPKETQTTPTPPNYPPPYPPVYMPMYPPYPPAPGPCAPGAYPPVQRPRAKPFPTGRKEISFGLVIVVFAMLLCNFVLFGGFNLGFAVGLDLCIVAAFVYLMAGGNRLTPYSAMLLVLSLVTGAGFGRSDDAFVKFIMLCFLFVSVNLGLTLLAGQQHRNPGGFLTMGDCFYTGFVHSLGRFVPTFSGLAQALSRRGEGFRKGSAVVKGLLIALPILIVMVVLLVRADAAFEGLVGLLPDLNLWEILLTLFFGAHLCCMLYAKGLSLQHSEKKQAQDKPRKGVSSVTIHTILIAICLVYGIYLVSQLAYFVGGFSGILPDSYTMAQYARRGFFEMAWLCAINLGLIGLCVALVEKRGKAPLLTRLLCLFITVITVFFVATASAKMFLYIESYGLTRLRVLTQVIMLWLCLVTVLVAIWLFVPKLPYMKAVIATGLVVGALVLWADVDSQVARYNVDAYLSGDLQTVDMAYLEGLNDAAVPHIARLARDAQDYDVRQAAQTILADWYTDGVKDFRDWNYASHSAIAHLPNSQK